MTDEALVTRWMKDVEIAYRTKAYQESFYLYWDITASLRSGMSEEDINEMKAVKRAAWDALEA